MKLETLPTPKSPSDVAVFSGVLVGVRPDVGGARHLLLLFGLLSRGACADALHLEAAGHDRGGVGEGLRRTGELLKVEKLLNLGATYDFVTTLER